MARICRILLLICLLLFGSVGVSAAETEDPVESVDLSLLEDAVRSLEESMDGTVSLTELLDDMIHGRVSFDLSSVGEAFL